MMSNEIWASGSRTRCMYIPEVFASLGQEFGRVQQVEGDEK
jgi:hypothetical protein